jgi:molybdate transport system substrate-binding protein
MITNRTIGALMIAALTFAAVGCGKPDAAKTGEKKEVMVFAAASLKEAMQELGKAFEAKDSSAHIVFNFAGSNVLAQQIVATKKADIFLSASENWVDTVEQAKRVVVGSRKDLLSNKLVVIANSASNWTVAEPCAIAALPFKNIALGDPKAVPAGKYAHEWLASVQCNGHTAWDSIEKRVSPAPDVRAALGMVVADPDVIGIAYKSDQLAFKDKTKVLFEVADGPKIRYAIAQITDGPDAEDARKFAEFLSGPDARAVFEKHGFIALPAVGSTTP